MKSTKSSMITYRRIKDDIEITGDSNEIKNLIWFDLICNKLKALISFRFFLLIVPKASWLLSALQWFKKQLPFLIVLLVQVNYLLMFLSD
jgi:hypothetical protein